MHPWPDNIIIQLHNVFGELASLLKKDPSRLEFKFGAVTKNSYPIYKKCLKVLEHDPDWRFFSVVINLNDPKFHRPKDRLEQWNCYLRWIKILLQRNIRAHEKVTLVADYLQKPKGEVYHICTMPAVVPRLWDVLQVESQGILLVQMADVLLGGSLYGGVDVVNKQLSDDVNALRATVGKLRFNEWRLKWE